MGGDKTLCVLNNLLGLGILHCPRLILLTHISNLKSISESSDRRHHQYLCGCERDEDAPEVST
jgi:hypothetical protein